MAGKDLGEGIENFEQEVENLKNTKMKIFGITMTPTTIATNHHKSFTNPHKSSSIIINS